LIRLGTWKIVVGILISISVFVIASFLDFIGIEWIYSNASPAAVIAMIISFHPELRKIFERAASVRRSKMTTSIFLTGFFWTTLIVAQDEMLEKVVTVPVEYTSASSNLILVGDKAKEVRLHLVGQKSNLICINPDQLRVKLDLSKAVSGKQSFVITNENSRLPKGINLLDVVPSNVEFTLAEIIEQAVSVEPQLVGKLPNGLNIQSIKVTPERVKVLSPATVGKRKPLTVTTIPFISKA
jgi:hypothetical protein